MKSSELGYQTKFFIFKYAVCDSKCFVQRLTCFQPSSFLTAGLVNENRLLRLDIGPLLEDSPSSVSMATARCEASMTHRARSQWKHRGNAQTAIGSHTWYSPQVDTNYNPPSVPTLIANDCSLTLFQYILIFVHCTVNLPCDNY